MTLARADLVSTLLVLAVTLLLASWAAWWWAALAAGQPGLERPDDRGRREDGPRQAPELVTPPSGGLGGVAIAGALERVLLARMAGALHCREAPGGCAARVARLARAIAHESSRAGADPWLVAAVVLTESGGHPGAIGRSAGELGLMQLHPAGRWARTALAACTQRDYTARERCRGVHLLRQGVALLARCLSRYGREPGLAAYHTGRRDSERGLAYARRVWRLRDVLAAEGAL